MKRLISAALVLLSAQAQADGWTSDFHITSLYVSGPTNFYYRVYGMPTVSTCTNGSNWAYVNQGDAGSSGYITAILMA
jgi:hypothetical protein